jgi:membrane protease YdiL (CAAX protease family)
MGWAGTLAVFGAGMVLAWLATRVIIPALAARTSVEPVLWWFLIGGLVLFAPLLLIAAALLHREPRRPWSDLWRVRLRFGPPTAGDWLWALAGLVLIAVGTGLTALAVRLFAGNIPLHPPFLKLEPLGPGRYWILAVWLPFWLLNIFGEEILWRGVVLPRQEVAFGRWAWLANAAGWSLFHIPLGLTILALLWPCVLVLPYLAQRQRNTWVAVVLHAGLNGPGFVAVALGWV